MCKVQFKLDMFFSVYHPQVQGYPHTLEVEWYIIKLTNITNHAYVV